MAEPDKEGIMKFQALQQQLQTIQQQLQIIEQQIQELEELQNTLEEFKTAQKDKEMFVNIGSGVFVKGELKESEKVYITVGSGTMVPKTIDEAKEVVSKQTEDLNGVMKQLQDTATQILKELQGIRDEFKE